MATYDIKQNIDNDTLILDENGKSMVDKTKFPSFEDLEKKANKTDLDNKQNKLSNSGYTFIDNNEVQIYVAPTQPLASQLLKLNIYSELNNMTVFDSINSKSLYLKENWQVKGTKTNNRTWTYQLVNNKKYRLSFNWNAPNTKSFQILIFTYLGDEQLLQTCIESTTMVTITGISVIQQINLVALYSNSNGIIINSKYGTTTLGNIINLEELQ